MLHMLKHPYSSDKRLLFCDLDGTLIYSHRHAYAGKTVWVEELHGHPQSFMTRRTCQYFLEQQWLHVVPLTTRNHAQFERLWEIADKLRMPEALICNGAVLLINHKEDMAWRAESEAAVQPVQPHLAELKRLAEAAAGRENVIVSEPFLFYVRSDRAEDIFRMMLEAADPEQITVRRDARKVYCIPRVLSKGNAALRYSRRVGAEGFLAAGDSDFDISMLCAAEAGFCPAAMKENGSTDAAIYGCGGWFSDTLCDKLEEIRIEAK